MRQRRVVRPARSTETAVEHRFHGRSNIACIFTKLNPWDVNE